MLDDETPRPAYGAAALRLGIGLAQGLALYGVWEARRAFSPLLGALALVAALVPIVALGAVGALRRATLWIWLAAATLIVAGLGAYDVWRLGDRAPPSPPVYIAVAASLFIAHHLIIPADAERRWRATYARYFDDAWKDGVRLALAVAFVGALWIILRLGAALFDLIGLKAMERLISKPWFISTATTSFFAIAVHLTDVRVGLVRGARTLALTLLSWLLPVMAVLVAGFLLALPFTGLEPLWATRSAAGILLAAAAALIILVNAAYQDGEREGFPPAVLKWSARAAALMLVPLAAVAAYGLALRIGQHGLTPARIYAFACVVVASCYALGYAAASVSRGAWMQRLEPTNLFAGYLIVGALLALFSPVLDPARISVSDQVRRLETGRIAPEAFDYKFLRFDAGRWGRDALKRMAAGKTGPHAAEVAEMARAVQRSDNRYDEQPIAPRRRAGVLHSVGGALPASFLTQFWTRTDGLSADCARSALGCVALSVDFDGDGVAEVAVFADEVRRVYRLTNGTWSQAGMLAGPSCPSDVRAFREGRYRIAPPKDRLDIEVGGRRLVYAEDWRCPAAARKEAAAPGH